MGRSCLRPSERLPSLRDAEHCPLVSTRVLTWHKTEPACKMPAVPEFLPIADSGDNRSCGLWANALDLRDPLAGRTCLEHGGDLLVEGADAPVEIAEQVPKFRNGIPGHLGKLVRQVTQDLRDHPSCSGDRRAEGKAAVEKKAADLTNSCCSVVDQPLTSAVERLDVLLFDGSLRHERNVRLAHRGTDRFSVITVVLLTPHERFDVLRTDNLHAVTELLELTSPTEGTGAGLDRDCAGL